MVHLVEDHRRGGESLVRQFALPAVSSCPADAVSCQQRRRSLTSLSAPLPVPAQRLVRADWSMCPDSSGQREAVNRARELPDIVQTGT